MTPSAEEPGEIHLSPPETEPALSTYETRDWANENVLHVYPRTFNEARQPGELHRGMGTILGITEKLDWMKETGLTAIWLGPIYESPGLDGNYDISDYRKINPELGTMADVEQLLAEAHKRDIRVIFDLVPNHTSDQSEWFKASSDPAHPRHDEYKDYYIWRDAIPGELPENITGGDRLAGLPGGYTVPNNWSSIFSLSQIDKVREANGGTLPENPDIPAVTAWVWSQERQQFYLAEFMKEQPTLNWSNPAVCEEIKAVMRFWLDKGVDSFRVDIMNHIGKDLELRDEEPAPRGTAIGEYNPGKTNPHDQWKQQNLVGHWPELGQYAQDMLSVLREAPYQNRNIRLVIEDWMSALSGDTRLDELSPDLANVFNFKMLLNTVREHWNARTIGRIIGDYYDRMRQFKGAVPNQVTGNHDTDTLRTRLGAVATAQAAQLMLSTLPGTLYIWQGDVLGRPNAVVPKERQRDGDIGKRDGERIPMQWNGTANGAFSEADPATLWLPSVDAKFYKADNLELQRGDPNSPYRKVAQSLRRRLADPALRSDGLQMLHTDHSDVLAFARTDPTNPRRHVISLTNFTQNTITRAAVLDAGQTKGIITASSHGWYRISEEVDMSKIRLEPDESLLIDSEA